MTERTKEEASTYDKGVHTGFALVAEMIEREDFDTLPQMYRFLMDRCKGAALTSEKTAVIDHNIRTFETGATRSPLGDKLQYEGYLSPLVLTRFAEYMRLHQTDSAGNRRDSDNWQKGIDRSAYMDSMARHFFDVWLHHRESGERAAEDIETALCGLFFNVQGMLFEVLRVK